MCSQSLHITLGSTPLLNISTLSNFWFSSIVQTVKACSNSLTAMPSTVWKWLLLSYRKDMQHPFDFSSIISLHYCNTRMKVIEAACHTHVLFLGSPSIHKRLIMEWKKIQIMCLPGKQLLPEIRVGVLDMHKCHQREKTYFYPS
ncbi:hypothetical protein KY284_015173 [Solanum tuberosum]|nr:hypothetical protein KY284_015173 [Solanum tuberosum]